MYAWELHLEGYCHHSISNSWVFFLCWQKRFRCNYLSFYQAIPSTVRPEKPPPISPSKDGSKNPMLSSWIVYLPFIHYRCAQKARSNEMTTNEAGESSLYFSFHFPCYFHLTEAFYLLNGTWSKAIIISVVLSSISYAAVYDAPVAVDQGHGFCNTVYRG